MMIHGSISKVVKDNICVGCGACASVCCQKAIEMLRESRSGLYTPFVDESLCTSCSQCSKVCPVICWSNVVKTVLNHQLVGDYVQAYSSYAVSDDIRIKSASGGFITALLVSLLKSKVITGAVVSRRVQGDPLKAETIIATTVEEILSCSGSIYSPVCFAGIFQEISNLTHDAKLAVVGLPCHIQALTLLMSHDKALDKRIALTISLVCGHVPISNAYRYAMKRLGVQESDVVDIDNRGDGWPGFLRFELKNGRIIRVPYSDDLSWGMVLGSPLFTPRACHVCPDPGGYSSDLMVCDAWLPRFKGNEKGINLVLAKSQRGDSLIKLSQANGDISLDSCSLKEFLEANKWVFLSKTKNRSFAMRYLVGKSANNFHKNISGLDIKLKYFERIKLWIYFQHVKFIHRFELCKAGKFIPRLFLFYLKAISLMKR